MRSRAALHYRVEPSDLQAHLFAVTLSITRPAPSQLLSLPVWIPGSYMVRDFSSQLQQLGATQNGAPLALEQVDKCSWRVACDARKPLILRYKVYARDRSVRAAWLDCERGFFNGTSVFLRVTGQELQPHTMDLRAGPSGRLWRVATGLTALKVNARGFGTYLAADYDELVDSPIEMGEFWSGSFVACGITHRFVVAGAAPSFDGERLLADSRRICEAAIGFWHGPAPGKRPGRQAPHKGYVFMLHAVDEGYGGLEHRNSTALICKRRDLPRRTDKSGSAKPSEGYGVLLGLISHEYFHTWNVKRLRPAEFERYHYERENYTSLLWFFEGFTSYYDDLLLCRAQLVDHGMYLKLLTKTINQVLQAPGRAIQSVAQASFDAWVKYYRSDENTPNATISYYAKGALVALCLDLSLRAEGHSTLDAVMRGLWQRCAGGPMTQDDLATVLLQLGGRSYAKELGAWVHGTDDLPLRQLLESAGVAVCEDPAQPAQILGLRLADATPLQVKTVLRGGAAEQAGFCAGDEWLGLETGPGQLWRLQRLEDVALYAAPNRALRALVARDQRLLYLPLTLPEGVTTWRLAVRDKQRLGAWLGTEAVTAK